MRRFWLRNCGRSRDGDGALHHRCGRGLFLGNGTLGTQLLTQLLLIGLQARDLGRGGSKGLCVLRLESVDLLLDGREVLSCLHQRIVLDGGSGSCGLVGLAGGCPQRVQVLTGGAYFGFEGFDLRLQGCDEGGLFRVLSFGCVEL